MFCVVLERSLAMVHVLSERALLDAHAHLWDKQVHTKQIKLKGRRSDYQY